MSHEGIVIVKEPNGVIADEYLKEVLEEYTSCSGAASSDGDELTVNTDRGPADVASIEKIQEEFLDKRVVFAFGKHPEGFPDDEIQPYTILADDNGDDVVVAFIDGECPGSVKTDSAYSSAYHFAKGKLTDMIAALWNEVEGDTDELMKKIESQEFVNQIKAELQRGAVVIMTYDDKVRVVTKTESYGDFDGFWCSDKLGYDEGDDQTTVSEVVKPTPVVTKRKNNKLSMSGTKPVEEKKPEPKKTEEETVKMRCPAGIVKNNQIRKWYEDFHGVVPGNYKSRPEVNVSLAKIRACTEGWAKAYLAGRSEARPLQALEEKINTTSPGPTNALPKNVPDSKPTTLPVVGKPEEGTFSLYLPPPEEIQKYYKDFAIRKDLMGIVDAQGNPLPLDVDKIQSTESKHTPVWDMLKTTTSKMMRWSDGAVAIFLSQYPRLRFRVFKALLTENYLLTMKVEQLEKENSKLEKAPIANPTTTKSGTPIVKKRA